MRKRVLFIDDGESFVVKGIKSNLEASGFECTLVSLNKDALVKVVSDIPEQVFIFIYEEPERIIDKYRFVKDVCVAGNCKIFLMGLKEDVDQIQDIFPKESIEGTFYRPINAKDVARELRFKLEESKEVKTHKHILLVDDSGALLNAVKDWLIDDYKVSMVNSALNAFFFLANNTPDLILLDYAMPVCSGPQFLEMLRSDSKTKDIPVIFLTGVEDKDSMEKLLSLHPEGYLLKSMSREGILSQIGAYFSSVEGK